jgi:hypothetical protein
MSHPPGQRLAVLARQRSDYRILVGVPPAEPAHWAVAAAVTEQTVRVEGHGDIPLAEVKAFIVAYPHGQVIDCELVDLPWPDGMTGLSPGQRRYPHVLQLADLREGQKYIQVRYGRSLLRPHDRHHYSTTLTNISGQRVRVLRFAGYARTREGWMLNSVSGTFYSAQEFREWYGLGQEELLDPGESACDPNNYGGIPGLWAYYCQAEDGKKFIAGDVLESGPG